MKTVIKTAHRPLAGLVGDRPIVDAKDRWPQASPPTVGLSPATSAGWSTDGRTPKRRDSAVRTGFRSPVRR